MPLQSLIESLIGGGGILPSRPIRAVGIDLGTTKCVAAEVIWNPASGEAPAARCIEVDQPTMEGTCTDVVVPSVVVVMVNGRTLIGQGARTLS